jgi:uncharacterized protein
LGHDWWHVYRVWKNAVHIGRKENADIFVVQLAALLHDIADWKFHSGDFSIGPKLAREWLEKVNVEEEVVSHVCGIIENMPFKGSKIKSEMKTKEGRVVQDADRLDAMGAIGVARVFTVGAVMKRPIFNPDIGLDKKVKDFRTRRSHSSIHHFYDKLLLLKDLMNTETGKKMAEERHRYMEQFLDRFFKEWEGKA